MIQEVKTLSEFQKIEQAWDDLYHRSLISNLFLTHTWLTLWIKHFGDGQTFALLYVPDGGRKSDWAGLENPAYRYFEAKPEAGVVLKRYNKAIGFIENDFSAYPDFLSTPHATGNIQGLLIHLKGNYLPSKLIFAGAGVNSVLCKNIERLAKDQWVPIFKYPSQMRSIVFSGTFDTYLKSQGAKFRSETRRKLHRAQRNYRVSLRTFSHSNETPELFEMIRAIEQDSWKAQIGSAIIHNEKQLRFYGDVFESYAEGGLVQGSSKAPRIASEDRLPLVQGTKESLGAAPTVQDKARAYVLCFDGQPASFVFGILSDRKYYALKTSYRLIYREYSPGLVLFATVIESLFKEKEVNRLEFLGSDARWKEEFSNHQEDFCTLELYPMGLKSLSYSMLYLYARPLAKRLFRQRPLKRL